MTWLRRNILLLVAIAVLGYMLIPNLVVALFSFNNPVGRYNYTWQQFSTEAWLNPCGAQGICESLSLSLQIGLIASLVATMLGTAIAFALGRTGSGRARRPTCSSSCRWRPPRSSWVRAC